MLTKTRWIGALGIVAVLALAGGVMYADNIQCKTCTVSVNSAGQLVLSYDITGLGNTSNATWTLSADVSGEARCASKSGNCPEAANKFGPTDQTSTGVFSVRNGRAQGSIKMTASSGLQCPAGQTAKVITVEYDNITFIVEGEDLSSELNTTSASSGTLFTCR